METLQYRRRKRQWEKTKRKRIKGKFTDACDAPNLDKDHERLIRIRNAVIDSSKEVNLFRALGAKDDVEQILATECEKTHSLSCNGESEDERHKSMKDLIMIIVNRYGGAISANTLQRLLGECKELGWAVVSLIAGGRLSAVSHTDGSPACFYIPTICD